MRRTLSPKFTPLRLVMTTSLIDGWTGSPNNSHIRLPASVIGVAVQNERPLARATL